MSVVKVYCESPELMLTKATLGAAGFDLKAKKNYVLWNGEPTFIETGIFLEIPEGFVGKLHVRSGLSTKNGIMLVNGTGIIDNDYRGEIKVALMLINSRDNKRCTYTINQYERVAQILFERVEQIEIENVSSYDDLKQTSRGVGGFGSTGTL